MTKPNTRFQKLTREGHSWTYQDKVYALHRDKDGEVLGHVWYEKVRGCAPEWCFRLVDDEGREGEQIGYPDWRAEDAAKSLLSEVGLRPTNHIPDGDPYCPSCGFWPNEEYVEEEGHRCIFCADKPAMVVKGQEGDSDPNDDPQDDDDLYKLLCRMVEASLVTERVPCYEPATRDQRLALLEAVRTGKLPMGCVGFAYTPDGEEFLAKSSAESMLLAVEEWGADSDPNDDRNKFMASPKVCYNSLISEGNPAELKPKGEVIQVETTKLASNAIKAPQGHYWADEPNHPEWCKILYDADGVVIGSIGRLSANLNEGRGVPRQRWTIQRKLEKPTEGGQTQVEVGRVRSTAVGAMQDAEKLLIKS